MAPLTESVVEQAALAWLEASGWRVAHGPEIAPDMPAAERADYGEVVLAQRLRDALARLNPARPVEALEDTFRKLTRPEGADLIQRNCARRLALLVEQKRLVAEGRGKGRRYRLPPGDVVVRPAPAQISITAYPARVEIYPPISPEVKSIKQAVRAPVQNWQPVGYRRDFLDD